MDISILSDNKFEISTFRKVSGFNQLAQTVILELIREEDSFLGRGGGLIQLQRIPGSNEGQAYAIASGAVSKTRFNILKKQTGINYKERLKELSLTSVEWNNGWYITVEVISETGEVGEVSTAI
jgi:hypothetical protein